MFRVYDEFLAEGEEEEEAEEDVESFWHGPRGPLTIVSCQEDRKRKTQEEEGRERLRRIAKEEEDEDRKKEGRR